MSENFTHLHWAFVVAAYAVTAFGLGALTVYVLVRLRHWKKRADDADHA